MAASLAYVPAASADTIFSDGFESGNFSAWSLVQTGGDGTAAVESQIVRSGALAAQFTETANTGSRAYARETFGAAQTDLTATGDFYVAQQGASGGNVPLFRLLDPTSTRLVSVYRQNGTSGTIGVGYGGKNFSSTGKLALGTWGTVSVHVVVAGASSTIAITLNGNTVYQATGNLGSAGVATLQIGNDTTKQAGSVVVDNVTAESGSSSTPDPPVQTTPPSISGTPQQGRTLTASPGSWGGTQPISYAYQWQRCDTSGANCAAISGATGTSYTTTSADVGATLEVTVTATNSAGSNSATSSPTAVVQAPASQPANTTPPTISGTAQVGQTLTASPGSWSGAQPLTYAYQWQRCDASGASCTAISGASQPTFTIAPHDLGSTLVVAVTASNSAGSATASSAPTAVVGTSSGQPALVALWHMNETSGTTMYDAVGSDNGTNHNVQLGVPGFAGTAYGFNGSSSYVSVPSTDDLNPYNANVTVSIDLKTTGTPPPPPGDWDLIRKGDYHSPGPWNEFKMELQQNGQLSCGFEGTGGYVELQAGPAVNDGQWHTAQCVKTTTAIEVVVDGQVFSKSAKLGSISNTLPLVVGAHPGADWYNGSLDEASLQFASQSGNSSATPPVNVTAPSISGTPQQGQTLTASPGTWSGTQPITYSYLWKRCDTTGANCVLISGATHTTYSVTAADVGHTLRVAVKATNSAGSIWATSAHTSVVQASSSQRARVHRLRAQKQRR